MRLERREEEGKARPEATGRGGGGRVIDTTVNILSLKANITLAPNKKPLAKDWQFCKRVCMDKEQRPTRQQTETEGVRHKRSRTSGHDQQRTRRTERITDAHRNWQNLLPLRLALGQFSSPDAFSSGFSHQKTKQKKGKNEMQTLGQGHGCIPQLHVSHCRRTASPSPPAPPHLRSARIRTRRLKICIAAVRASAAEPAQMERGQEVKVVKLRAVEATPESFAPFGQVIAATPDGDEFGPHDAQLDLSRGIPRFYIMRLENRPLKFSSITHHASVTQCLGSIGGQDWYLGVAKPSIVDDGAAEQSGGQEGRKPVRSAAGHYYLPPDPAEVCVFRVSGAKFLKLNTGTWHAGPLFKADAVDFYNLELSNTNVVDHTTHYFKKHDGITFAIED
ncbi:hypothetical protein U9M48_017256 [Paspalum notatum var. saurae]|uniref:Ureidoglycolate hydrolase n=1 Tax=Paspalum notatum var. saurae TaxID=547442 RepID=A0AAQ3TB53_PASNO